jgi:hypothetical protein
VILDRLVELVREVGMLVIALTPLDVVIAKGDPALVPGLTRIFWAGVGLFVLSLFGEWLVGFLAREDT